MLVIYIVIGHRHIWMMGITTRATTRSIDMMMLCSRVAHVGSIDSSSGDSYQLILTHGSCRWFLLWFLAYVPLMRLEYSIVIVIANLR